MTERQYTVEGVGIDEQGERQYTVEGIGVDEDQAVAPTGGSPQMRRWRTTPHMVPGVFSPARI